MKPARASLCLATLFLLPAIANAQSAATLGNNSINADEIRQIVSSNAELTQRFKASADAIEPILKEELVRRALINEALTKGWDKQAAVARQIEQATNSVILSTYVASLSTPPGEYPGDPEIKAFFDANQGKINTPSRYRLAQIFIGRPANPQEAQVARQRADSLAKQVIGGGDFAALARSFSDDVQSRERGGEVDWIEETNMTPEILALVRTMKPGATSDPVETQAGWHIVRLLEFQTPAPATLEQARPAIVNALRSQRASEISRAYVDDLLKKTPVNIDRAALDAVRAQLK
jgi:peptidylprolyl isomerase